MSLIDSLPVDEHPEAWPTVAAPELRVCRSGEGLLDWFRSRQLAELLGYWLGQRQDADVPARDSIDPLDLHAILGWVLIFDRNGQGGDFRFRLVGSRVSELFGVDLTGLPIESLPDKTYAAFVRERVWETIDRSQPVASRFTRTGPDGRALLMERLDLPLLGGGDRVEFVLTGLIPLARARAQQVLRTAI